MEKDSIIIQHSDKILDLVFYTHIEWIATNSLIVPKQIPVLISVKTKVIETCKPTVFYYIKDSTSLCL